MKFYWALYILRAAFGPCILFVLLLFSDNVGSSSESIPIVYIAMFGTIAFFFPPVFYLLSRAYFLSKHRLALGHDPFPAFRRFPASNVAVRTRH